MKRFIAGALALVFALAASATTLNPVQLLNPAGSTSGQAPVSTGPTTPPTWGNVSAAALAAQAANTVVANATGSSASPTAIAMPSCSAATSALKWTSNTGIGCNSSIQAATLGGTTFAAPGPIGSTTASTGAFTTLNASGNDALLYFNGGGQSLTSATATTITGWTKIYDRVNANFNASTGTFTAPAECSVTCYYQVNAQLTYTNATNVVATSVRANIVINGVTQAIGVTWEDTTANNFNTVNVAAVVAVTNGQTILIQGYQDSGSARTIITSASPFSVISINRIP